LDTSFVAVPANHDDLRDSRECPVNDPISPASATRRGAILSLSASWAYATTVPELRHLRYFVAVAEELNFSRAARRLRMAQPPLSVAIRQLEQEIGTSLFHRSSREVKLTAAGAVLLERAHRTLAEAEGAVVAARRAGAGELGRLRLGYSWTARFETLPALGQALRGRSPDVELLTEEMRTQRMPAALRSGAIDIALAVHPEVVSELAYRVLRRERIVAVISSAHALAEADEIALEALAGDLILFPRDLAPSLHDFYLSLCRRAGFEPRDARESSRTRWTIGTWNPSTAVLLPESVSGNLPNGTVAIRLAVPDLLETKVFWRADDLNPTLVAFIELAGGVFTRAPIVA
jgi:DNA-binding transcriptional LysR family regulator